ncbi:Sensor histidine kinase DcuS [Trichinella pseudospiralis]
MLQTIHRKTDIPHQTILSKESREWTAGSEDQDISTNCTDHDQQAPHARPLLLSTGKGKSANRIISAKRVSDLLY